MISNYFIVSGYFCSDVRVFFANGSMANTRHAPPQNWRIILNGSSLKNTDILPSILVLDLLICKKCLEWFGAVTLTSIYRKCEEFITMVMLRYLKLFHMSLGLRISKTRKKYRMVRKGLWMSATMKNKKINRG